MLDFLTENWGTILVSALLAAAVIAAFLSLRRARKKGAACACGGSCGQCACSGMCHKQP